MGKLVISEECLVPRRRHWLKYNGPDPVKFLRDLKTNLRFIFEVSTTRCRRKKLLWDYSGDPIRFYDEWEVKKELSRFSNMFFYIRVIGHVKKAKNEGDFAMEIYGEIVHTFQPSNWFTKYIWLFYNYIFYDKLRESQIEMCRGYFKKYYDWCRENYGLTSVATPEDDAELFREDMEGVE